MNWLLSKNTPTLWPLKKRYHRATIAATHNNIHAVFNSLVWLFMNKQSINTIKTPASTAGIKALALAAGALTAGAFIGGCVPQGPTDTTPTATAIFEPNPNTSFGTNSGDVSINALSDSTVCYTTDGSAPTFNTGTCSGGSTETYQGDAITLDCGDESAEQVFKAINIAFEWEGLVKTTSANYVLNCKPLAVDLDSDGIIEGDNCPETYNPDQADSDNNGIGDACQDDSAPDADKDGRPDGSDNCENVWNVDQRDNDGDGIGNVCDDTPEGAPTLAWANATLLADWNNWEQAIRCELNYKRNGSPTNCSDPGGTDGLGSVTVDCPEGGSANWTNSLSGLGADTTFTYTNCTHTVNGRQLIVNGRIAGWFNASGTSSGNSGTFNISGDYSAKIEDRVQITSRVKKSGYYLVQCSEDPIANEICAPNNLDVRFNAPAPFPCDGGICPEASLPLSDSDNDGVFDLYDNCPDVSNADQANMDYDALGDACDDSSSVEDIDGDGVIDNADNCPNDANADQLDTDNDQIGDACDPTPNMADIDQDGVEDSLDNCKYDANSDQADWNNNSKGDVCDDSDGDLIKDNLDNCREQSNPDQADKDGDSIGDVCDEPSFYLLKVMSNGWCYQPDNNGDVLSAACDASNTSQQWELSNLGSRYQFKNVATGRCMRGYTSWAVPYVNLADCNSGNSDQQWQIRTDGSDADSYPLQLKPESHNFCIWNFGQGSWASGTLGNCGLADKHKRSIGLYPEGDFSVNSFDFTVL
jgi:hypothetical protein